MKRYLYFGLLLYLVFLIFPQISSAADTATVSLNSSIDGISISTTYDRENNDSSYSRMDVTIVNITTGRTVASFNDYTIYGAPATITVLDTQPGAGITNTYRVIWDFDYGLVCADKEIYSDIYRPIDVEIYNAANTAATNALNAKSSADNANSNAYIAATRAQTTIDQTWYSGAYGGSPESVGNIAGYIRNQQLPTVINNTTYNSQSAAYWAYQAAQNATPTISKVQGQNGATCTTGSTFTVVISATPSSGASYRVTCGSFDSGWVSNNTITINSVASGANTATVQVKNAAGTTAQTTFTFFKV